MQNLEKNIKNKEILNEKTTGFEHIYRDIKNKYNKNIPITPDSSYAGCWTEYS